MLKKQIIFLIIGIFILLAFGSVHEPKNKRLNKEKRIETIQIDYFKDIQIEAKSALVYDINKNKILFAKNHKGILPIASITKVMTAIVANEKNKNAKIFINRNDLKQEGDSGLFIGEEWNIKNLSSFTLVSSSNDGAAAIARSCELSELEFVQSMNEKAKLIGMKNTFFINQTGLDETDGLNGGYSTAEDIAEMFLYALKNHSDIFINTSEKETHEISKNKNHIAVNTNTLASTMNGLIMSKTGYTDIAGGNLAIIFEIGPMQPIIIVVLGSTYNGRFTDVNNLALAARSSILGM